MGAPGGDSRPGAVWPNIKCEPADGTRKVVPGLPWRGKATLTIIGVCVGKERKNNVTNETNLFSLGTLVSYAVIYVNIFLAF